MIAELLSVVSERKPADLIEPNDVKVFQNAACTKDVPDAISTLAAGDVVGRNVDRFCLCLGQFGIFDGGGCLCFDRIKCISCI